MTADSVHSLGADHLEPADHDTRAGATARAGLPVVGLTLLVSGVVTSLIVSLVGLLLLLAALGGWVQESRLLGFGEGEDENEDEATHE